MKNLLIITILFLMVACGEKDPRLPAVVQEVVTDNVPASACANTFVVRDTAYMIAGRNGTTVNEVWRFDAGSSKWTKVSKFPGVQRINTVAQVVGGKAYFGLGWKPPRDFVNTGGWTLTSYLKDFWSYDPLTNRWDSLAAFPGTDTNNPVSFVYDNEIYVLHGFESHLIASEGFSRKVRKYSVSNNTWTEMNDFPGYIRASAVAVSDGNRVFAGTGYATWNEQDWWEYFPSTDSWEKKKKMPDSGRCNGLAFTVKNRFFVSTGRYFAGIYTGGHVKKDIMEYDPETDEWFVRGTLPLGVENAISFVVNDVAYVGYGEDGTKINVKLWKIILP